MTDKQLAIYLDEINSKLSTEISAITMTFKSLNHGKHSSFRYWTVPEMQNLIELNDRIQESIELLRDES